MENIIPFTREINFENKISEIISISLEEKYTSTNDAIDGEFIISGDYKSHELSVNKEPFEYKLPFSVDLTESIDPDTLNLEITDFSYDILNDNVLKVNIEFKFDALVLKQQKESNLEETLEFLNEDRKEEDLEIIEVEETKKEESIPQIEEINKKEDEKENKMIEDENRMDVEDENTIIESINDNDSEFTTYHIHIVKEAETIESICALYNSNTTMLAEYNDLNDFKVGDKLIVVESDE